MVRNECFRVAIDYLYKNGLVVDQKELSEKTKLSQTAISRILNNRVKEPSEASIRKLNEAFGNLFGSGGTLDVSVNEAWESPLERTW